MESRKEARARAPALGESKPDPRPMVDRLREDLWRLFQTAGIEYVVDFRRALGPFLNSRPTFASRHLATSFPTCSFPING